MSRLKPIENSLAWRAVPKTIEIILVATCALTVLVSGAAAIMRYVFKTDLYGVEEWLVLITMWLYFLGATYGSYEESHIKGDLLNLIIKTKKQRKGHQIYVYLYSSAILVVWGKWAVDYFIRCLGTGQRTPGWHFPVWTSQIAISIGIFGMLFYSIYHLIRTIIRKSERLYPDETEEDEAEKGDGQLCQ